MRCGDWKLIEFFEDGRRDLYSLGDDISEDLDLAADHPDITRDLYERQATWRDPWRRSGYTLGCH